MAKKILRVLDKDVAFDRIEHRATEIIIECLQQLRKECFMADEGLAALLRQQADDLDPPAPRKEDAEGDTASG